MDVKKIEKQLLDFAEQVGGEERVSRPFFRIRCG